MPFQSLKDFDIAADDIRYLEGNCGRAVKRTVSRFFQYGKARLPVTFPEVSVLTFAYVLSRAADGCLMAEKHLHPASSPVQFSIVDIDVPARSFKVLIDSSPAVDGVKALQSWFREMAQGLSRVTCMLEFCPSGYTDTELLGLVLGSIEDGNVLEEDLEAYALQFYALAAGDLSHVLTAPVGVVQLAARLDPKVEEAIEAMLESTIDEALSI